MGKIRNKILVIDIESTCWQKDTKQESEIIEIGLCELVRTGTGWELGRTESIAIRPVFSTVSAFCTHLTGWTEKELRAKGVSHEEAIRKLKHEYKSKDSIIACWGKYDDKMFQKMAKMHPKTGYPFNNDYLNVKALYGAKHGRVDGVSAALQTYGMEFQGTPHRGLDDSIMIAHLLLKLLE